MRRWSVLAGLASVVAGLALAGCAAGRVALSVPLDPRPPAIPAGVERLATHEAAVQGVAAILIRDVGLPLPPRVKVYVYASRPAFERGLIRDGDVSAARAAELGDFAVGVGKRRALLLYQAPGESASPEWYRLIAHELTHVAQIELAGGEGRAEQWLAEGLAEWAAVTVLERLALDTVDRRRALAVKGIRSLAALRAAQLDLETLGTPRGFTVRHLREGSVPTYQLAFLMTDYLIARDGRARVVDYFASFERRLDRREAFRRAFGQTLEDFEEEIVAHLTALVR